MNAATHYATVERDNKNLRESLKTMLAAYWGKGDGEPAPQFIKDAAARCGYELSK